jgi:GTP cyclohydrolase I
MSRLPALVEELLKEIGEDPGREGLRLTPDRVSRAFRVFTEGYTQDPAEVLNGAIFDESYN